MSDTGESGKKRSPVERAIVWGVIGVLVVVVAIEGRARMAYSSTLSSLGALVKQAEQNDEYVTLSQARAAYSGSPTEESQPAGRFEQSIILKWFSLLKTYQIEIQVEPGEDDPAFLGFTTPDADAGLGSQELAPVAPSESADGEYFDMSDADNGTPPGAPESTDGNDTPPVDSPGQGDTPQEETPADPADVRPEAEPAETE